MHIDSLVQDWGTPSLRVSRAHGGTPSLRVSRYAPRFCPPFSACRQSFCPKNWPNLSFYSDLVGSRFDPYWFWPRVPPPPPPPPGCSNSIANALELLQLYTKPSIYASLGLNEKYVDSWHKLRANEATVKCPWQCNDHFTSWTRIHKGTRALIQYTVV